MNKSIKINDIKREAGRAILSLCPEHKQLNASREALVSLIDRIPIEQRTEAEAALKCLATPGNTIEQWYSARSEHKSGRVLLVAASRKLLRMLWGCARADISKVHHRIA